MNKRSATWCFVATIFTLAAQGQSVDAVIDRNEILIGEQAIISLSVSYPKGQMPDVVFPVLADTLTDKVEVLRSTGVDTLRTLPDAGSNRLEKKVFVTAFDSGYYAIPPFDFVVNGDTETTEAFLLTVHTVAIDTTAGIKNIKDIYEVEVTFLDYLKAYRSYVLGALGLIVAILVVLWFLRRRRMRARAIPRPEPKEPARPADVVALEELERIRRERAYARGQIKRFHTEITEVVRDYIDSTTDVSAHELTSSQILKRLRYSGLDEKEARTLREILLRADMVKFAREKPEEDENQAAVKLAINFVRATAPLWVNRETTDKDESAA